MTDKFTIIALLAAVFSACICAADASDKTAVQQAEVQAGTPVRQVVFAEPDRADAAFRAGIVRAWFDGEAYGAPDAPYITLDRVSETGAGVAEEMNETRSGLSAAEKATVGLSKQQICNLGAAIMKMPDKTCLKEWKKTKKVSKACSVKAQNWAKTHSYDFCKPGFKPTCPHGYHYIGNGMCESSGGGGGGNGGGSGGGSNSGRCQHESDCPMGQHCSWTGSCGPFNNGSSDNQCYGFTDCHSGNNCVDGRCQGNW
jgi:hypothetical protein